MEEEILAFTAVYLKSSTLQKLAALVFEEQRREAEALIAGKDVVRETFVMGMQGGHLLPAD